MRARIIGLLAGVSLLAGCASAGLRGTGDLGVVIERANGSVQLVSTTERAAIGRVDGLGDLSHASVVYSRDGRYGYVFGRDGGLTKIDLLRGRRFARHRRSRHGD
jgi:protein NirF